MSKPRMQRASFTLSPELIENLSYLSRRLGITKSALVNDILGSAIGELRSLVETIPENPQKSDMLRFRGASEELIKSRLASVQRMQEGDLFDGQ